MTLSPTPRAATLLTSIVLIVVACGGKAGSAAPATPTTTPATAAPAASHAATSSPVASTAAAIAPEVSALDSPMFKGSPGRTGEYPGRAPTGPLTQLWQRPNNGELHTAPAVIGGSLFLVAGDGHVLALDVATGAVQWKSTGDAYTGSVAAAADRLFVLGSDGSISSLALKDGHPLWRTASTIAAFSWPVVTDGTVVAGGSDGHLYAFDATTGTARWMSDPAAGGDFPRGPSAGDGKVFAGSTDGTFTAVAAATGKVAWKHATTSGSFGTSAVRDGAVFVNGINADGSGELFAFDAATGEIRWRMTPPGGQAPGSASADGTAVYVGDADGVIAVKETDGSILWSSPALPAAVNPIVIADDTLVVNDQDTVVGLDRHDGSERWRVELGGPSQSPVVVADGRVIVGMFDGAIRAFGADDLALGATPSVRPSASVRPPVFAEHVGSLTGAPGGLAHPSEIGRDQSGKIWVVEAGSNDVAIFGADGTFIERWGKSGTGAGSFDFKRVKSVNPWGGITLAPDGSIYVADSANFRVQHFDAARKWLASIGAFGKTQGKFLDPVTTTVGPDGRLYVVDDVRDDIQVFSASGAFERTIGSHGSGPGQIRNAGGVLVVGDRLYEADYDNGRIDVFGTDGTVKPAILPPGLQSPTTMDLGPDGRIYIADSAGAIYAMEQDGTLVDSWSVPGNPGDVEVLSDGRVLVTDFQGDSVEIYRLP